MICPTRDFGQVEIDESMVLNFVQPVYGFEEYKKYALLYDREAGDHIVWLQSLEEPELCFILLDPASVYPAYAPVIPESLKALLGEGEYIYRVLTVIPAQACRSTVNLKSPIVINPENRQAAQTILEQDYPLRFPLLKGEE
ncbi:MAG: flagellar assembly protein FliW [Peptococcaceae bacterium]|nr:flagellar assembly protein FliW [Peptococcaceae bacterium]